MVQGLDKDLGLRTRTCGPRTRHGLEVQGQGRVVQGLDKDLGLRTRTCGPRTRHGLRFEDKDVSSKD